MLRGTRGFQRGGVGAAHLVTPWYHNVHCHMSCHVGNRKEGKGIGREGEKGK